MQLCQKLCKKFFHSYSKDDLEQNSEVQNVQLIKKINNESGTQQQVGHSLPKVNLIESTPNQSVSSKKNIIDENTEADRDEEVNSKPEPNSLITEEEPENLSKEDENPSPNDTAINELPKENVMVEVTAEVHEADQNSEILKEDIKNNEEMVMKEFDESIEKSDPDCQAEKEIESDIINDVDNKQNAQIIVAKVDQIEKQENEAKEKNDSDSEDYDDDDGDEEYDDIDDNNKRLANKYGDLGGQLLILNIPNPRLSNCNLGLRLSGNKDLNRMSIFICQIVPDSLADIDGRLQVGDEILEIDDHILFGRSHLNASPVLKSCHGKMIKFVIHRSHEWQSDMAIPVTYKYAEIIKKRVQFKLYPSTKSKSDEELLSNPSSRRSSVLDLPTTDYTSDGNKNRKVSSVSLGQISFLPSISTEETHIAYLTKGSQGLGFAIMEGSFTNEPGIYIKHLAPMGPAAHDGSLRPGDKLMSINNQDVTEASYDYALEQLRNCRNGSQVRLVVSRVRCATGAQANSTNHSPIHSELTSTNNQLSRKRLSAPNITIGNSSFSLLGISRSKSPTITEETSAVTASNDDLQITSFEEPRPTTPSKIQIKLIPESESGLQNYARNISENSARRKSSITNIPSADLVNVLFNNFQDDKNVETINIVRERKPLGLSIIGGSDTFIGDVIVHDIYPTGVVAKDGRLKVGDKLLMIDNISVLDKTHDDVLSMLHSADEPEISLKVRHQETPFQDHDIYEVVTTVELLKKPNKGLGISVIGREGAKGVYICDVVKGGVADADGRIHSGDQILEINGKDFRNGSQEEAATKLKCLMGQVTLKIGRIHHLQIRFTPHYLVTKEEGENDRLLSAKNVSNTNCHSPSRSPLSSPAHAR